MIIVLNYLAASSLPKPIKRKECATLVSTLQPRPSQSVIMICTILINIGNCIT